VLPVDATATGTKVFVLSPVERPSGLSKRTARASSESLPGPSDEVLFHRVQENDKEALSQLFHRYARALYSIGSRILRDNSEAEDMVQDVFLYIHKKHAAFDSSKGTVRSWIFQIAYTQALIRRRELRSQGIYALGLRGDVHAPEPRSDVFAEYDRSVEGLFGRNSWRNVLELLTEDQRETLRLHFFEGYTFEEIAEELGQTYVNVRNHHYRGLEKIRKYLTDDKLNRP
jgi:RNA polymerase sigma-70 factor (ECF subfamily)